MALRPVDFLLPHGNSNNGILNDYDHADDDPDFVPKGVNGEELKKLIHKTAAIIGKFSISINSINSPKLLQLLDKL
jgi:hypothetical protein